MSDLIQIASAALLEPAGLQQSDVEGLVGRMAGGAIDYADLYFQFTRHESWALEDGAVKSGSRNIDHGVGARAISGEKTGFSYSDEFELPIRSEEHTSELQSLVNLVCRLLLEKKKTSPATSH